MGLLAPFPTRGYPVQNDMIPTGTPVLGTALTAHTNANTVGSWVSLLSTISYDIHHVWVLFTNASTAGTPEQVFVNLGIGPDSSNVTTIADSLMAGCAFVGNIAGNPRIYNAPLFIPAGTQLWGQCQSTITGGNTVDCAVWAYGGQDLAAGFPNVYAWEAIGANTGTTLGTSITPGNAAFGSYAELTASCANDYIGLMAAEAFTDASYTSSTYVIKAGIGASTEQELGPCSWSFHDSSERIASHTFPVWADIPAGTRVALSMACSGAPDTGASVVAYGLRAA